MMSPRDDPEWVRWVELALSLGLTAWMVWMYLPDGVKWSLRGWIWELGQPGRARRAKDAALRRMGWETQAVIEEMDRGGDDLARRLEVA